ncbi:site-specific integrase [Fibrella aestuarina]|uniref:Site-specific integrase n=1 Tax=Fibrivirga algicola TaxID=2950420 RepID=A0ABX0QDY3_9BACT|nr:site-specific integrase [Fibrivirga algicola]
MADVKFLLKDPRASGPTLISLFYRYDNQRFVYSTGQSVEPYQWDAERQRAHNNQRNKTDRAAHETINAHLDRHRSALIRVITRLHLAGMRLGNATIKEHLDQELDKVRTKPVEAVPAQETFSDYIVRFVKEAEAGKRLTHKSLQYAGYTLAGYMKLYRVLLKYTAETGRPTDYADITLDFYHQFKLWLTGRKLTLNYVGTLLKDLKVMLKQSHADGMHNSMAYQHKDFKKLVEDVDNIYLTDAELTALYNLNLSTNPRLDRVRDLFLIGAYTGLRFSDFSQLRPENITHEGRIFTRKTIKTFEKVSIPLNPKVLAILTKYDGVPPRTISNQKLNTYLKELCKLADHLTEGVELGRTKGGVRQVRYVPKWDLVTSHTARRSFATNAYLAGVNPVMIMKVTGHRSEAVFLRYIKVSSEQNALLLLQHPHFSGVVNVPAQTASTEEVANDQQHPRL